MGLDTQIKSSRALHAFLRCLGFTAGENFEQGRDTSTFLGQDTCSNGDIKEPKWRQEH